MRLMNIRASLLVVAGLTMLLSVVEAQDSSSWTLRAGVHPIQTKPGSHSQMQVGDAAALTLAGTYMLARHWGVELLTALPVEHTLYLREGGKIGRVIHIPSMLSVQYHFLDPNGRARAHIGAGLNYTFFFDERTSGALAGTRLEYEPSLGPAVQLGLDLDIGGGWFIGLDARWLDIDAPMRLNGARSGTVELDPYAVGLSIGARLP